MLGLGKRQTLFYISLPQAFHKALPATVSQLAIAFKETSIKMEGAMAFQDGIGTSESRFAAYVETLSSALGHADRGCAAEGLLHRAAFARRAQERRAEWRHGWSLGVPRLRTSRCIIW